MAGIRNTIIAALYLWCSQVMASPLEGALHLEESEKTALAVLNGNEDRHVLIFFGDYSN